MITINRDFIKSFNPCANGWANYLKHHESFSGTVLEFCQLDNIPAADKLWLCLRKEVLPECKLHLLVCQYAENVLHIFESAYPNDKRPRQAIEAKRLWLEGKISDEQLAADAAAAAAAAYLADAAAAADAYAAYAAAYAADAAAAADAYAAYAAAYAADAAAYAADAAADAAAADAADAYAAATAAAAAAYLADAAAAAAEREKQLAQLVAMLEKGKQDLFLFELR